MSLRDALIAATELEKLRADRDDYLRRRWLGLVERDDAWLEQLDNAITDVGRRTAEALNTDPASGSH